jgi:hypothetical protein
MTQPTEISKAQKRLLKIVNCIFQQYVVCKTPATQLFLANPQDINVDGTGGPNNNSLPLYTNMKNELTALAATIQSLPIITALDTNTLKATVNIIVSCAEGVIAYDSDSENNTYTDFMKDLVNPDIKLSRMKGAQVLNTNEAAMLAYQIIPAKSCNDQKGTSDANNGDEILWTAQASVYERTGTNGPSNTGFLRFSVQVDINAYPFNPYTCGSCNCVGDESSCH